MTQSPRPPRAGSTEWIASVWQDLRYATRSLAAQPSFTAMASLALVLGIGLNTSVFTVINAVLTRPWNVPEPERVVNIYAENQWFGLAPTAARYLDENSRTVRGVVASRRYDAERGQSDDGGAFLTAAFVTANFFDVLEVGIALGRGFRADENIAGTPVTVAVISHSVWTRRYAADPNIIGSTVRFEGVAFTVIGIAGEGFTGIATDRTDLWLPFATYPVVLADVPTAATLLTDPGRCCASLAARLRPGVARPAAEAELSALYRRYLLDVAHEQSSGTRAPSAIVLTGTALLDNPARQQRVAPVLGIVATAFGLILLLACANVSNLVLARGTLRQRELAVRLTLGAGRKRIVRQLLTESTLLAGLASAGGLALAAVLPGALQRFAGGDLPDNLDLTPDAHVVGYAVVIALGSAIAFGLVPALHSTAIGNALSRQTARATPRARVRSVLLGVQVAISVMLLIAAALLGRGVERARSLDVGFATEGVTALRVSLPARSYDLASEAAFYDEIIANLEAGGSPAAVSMLLPLGERWENVGFGLECETTNIVTQRVSSGFFDVLRIPLVQGTTLRARGIEPDSMVVDESLAHACWGERSPLGQIVTVSGRPHEVVGVVRDARLQRVGNVQPTFYAPFVPDGDLVRGPAFVLVQSARVAAAVNAVRTLEPRAVVEPLPLDAQLERSLGTSASVARLAGGLGLLSLLLATIGVYGVIAYSVERRRREIGVRVTLGARPWQITAMVLRSNGHAVAIGLAVGLVLAAGASQILRSRLFGLSPLDPLAYAAVIGLLALAAIAASVIPARRAGLTDPVTAMHDD